MSHNASQQPGEVDSHTEEQTFTQWARKRFEMYQSIEQQTQASIAQTLQLSAEFTSKMEEEANRILSRYHDERAELQSQIDALRQEMSELRAAMERDQQEHRGKLALEQRQAAQAIAEQQKVARAERDKLLRDAHAERDRVLAETQQLMSTRLADLQSAMQNLFGSSRSGPASDRAAQRTEEPEEAEARGEVEEPQEPEEREESDEPQESTTEHEPEPGILLIIEDVDSFILASEIMDRFEQSESIAEVTLVQYEQNALRLSVQPLDHESVEHIIHELFGSTLEVLEQDHYTCTLVYQRAV